MSNGALALYLAWLAQLCRYSHLRPSPAIVAHRACLAAVQELDQPDLDFGFYRIMHAKAQEVQDFIGTDLLKIVADAFGEGAFWRMQGCACFELDFPIVAEAALGFH